VKKRTMVAMMAAIGAAAIGRALLRFINRNLTHVNFKLRDPYSDEKVN